VTTWAIVNKLRSSKFNNKTLQPRPPFVPKNFDSLKLQRGARVNRSITLHGQGGRRDAKNNIVGKRLFA
jgi:hypothetical protein